MNKGILAVALLALGGCTSTMNAAYQAEKTEAVTAVQTLDDNALQAAIQALCAMPYGAIVRNQAKVPNLGLIMPSACGGITSVPVTVQIQPVPTASQ